MSGLVRQLARALLRVAPPLAGATVGATSLAVVACEEPQRLPPPAVQTPAGSEPSPNASILPAPLGSGSRSGLRPDPSAMASATASGSSSAAPSASAPRPPVIAEPLREDQPPAPDVGRRGAPVLELRFTLSWLDLPAPTDAPAMVPAAREALLREVTPRGRVRLTGDGRVHVLVGEGAFLLPEGTVVAGRVDFFGHLLLTPSTERYRVLPPGTLLTTLDELRADVVPLLRARRTSGVGGRWSDAPTATWTLSTDLGELVLETAELPATSDGARVLCRSVLELSAIAPDDEVCARGALPIRAEIRWKDAAGVLLLVEEARKWLDPAELQVPPDEALFSQDLRAPDRSRRFVAEDALRTLRSEPATAPPDPTATAAPDAVPPPEQGLEVRNDADVLLLVLIDGVPVGWIPPDRTLTLPDLVPGRYSLGFRDYFGTTVLPARDAWVPGRIATRVQAPPASP